MYLALRLAHLMSAAVWFAATLTTASDVRRSLDQGGTAARGMLDRVKRTLALSSGAGTLALATGLGLIFVLGGFKHVPVRIHAGFGLSLVALALEASLLGSAFRRVAEGVTEDKLDDARAGAKQMAAFTGVLHLLRTAVFVVMVLRF